MNDYGCYRCGEINGDVNYDEDLEELICEECGCHRCILTFVQALDIINDAYLTMDYHYDGIDIEHTLDVIGDSYENSNSGY